MLGIWNRELFSPDGEFIDIYYRSFHREKHSYPIVADFHGYKIIFPDEFISDERFL
jgi:hypothetical protein